MRICRERATGKIFAMKKLQKSEMVRRGQVDHVKAERNVLTEVGGPARPPRARCPDATLLDNLWQGFHLCGYGVDSMARWRVQVSNPYVVKLLYSFQVRLCHARTCKTAASACPLASSRGMLWLRRTMIICT